MILFGAAFSVFLILDVDTNTGVGNCTIQNHISPEDSKKTNYKKLGEHYYIFVPLE